MILVTQFGVGCVRSWAEPKFNLCDNGGNVMCKKANTSIDYFTVRYAYRHDPDEVIVRCLEMDPALFVQREYGTLPGYRKSMSFGDIVVCYDGIAAHSKESGEQLRSADDMGVCVSMSGEGCRTFEHMSTLKLKEGGAMAQLIQAVYLDPDAHATRVDLAMDDHSGLLDMDTIIEYSDNSQINSRIRKTRVVSDRDGRNDLGKTLYIGAPSSAFRVRIYDKAKEQYAPGEDGYSKPWIRVEFVMRGKHADGFIAAFCNSDDLGKLAAGILNDHLRFIERDDSNITRCSTAQWWLDFLDCVEAVKLFFPEPIQHTIDRSIEWLTYQCSPSMATVLKAVGWVRFKQILDYGLEHMSAKHSAVLRDWEQRRAVTQNKMPGVDQVAQFV